MKKTSKFGLLLTGMLLCVSALQAQQQHQREIDRAETFGKMLFAQDRAVANATDRLRECCNLLETDRLAGWIVTRHETGGFLITYVVIGEDAEPAAKFRVSVNDGGKVRGEPEVLETPEPLSSEDLAQFNARNLALRADVKRCDNTYNTVAFRQDSGGDADWTVYLLRSTTQHGIIPAGTHYRFRISADGSRILDQRPFTNACLLLPAGEPPGIPVVTHLLDPVPTEIHVFLALLANVRLAVATPDTEGGAPKVWVVRNGKVRFAKELSDSIKKSGKNRRQDKSKS